MKKNQVILTLIILLGFILRIIGLAKDGGLWFDGLWTWHIAKETFPFGILHKLMTEDFHFPLYYFLLHFWMKIFGDGDFVLRGLSYIFGVLAIPASYFAGKELNNEKTGLLTAALVAVSSFCIYYSQEVRFYSLMSLLVFLSIYFLLKVIKQSNLINSVLLVISNLCLFYTNTIAFLFVIVEFLVFTVFIIKNKKEALKRFVTIQIATLFFSIPGILMFFKINDSANNSFIKPFSWWGPFDVMTILSTLQNWFSPIFNDGYNNASVYYQALLENDIVIGYLIFIPVIVFLILIACGIRKDKFSSEKSYIFSVGLLLFIILLGLCFVDKFRLIPRYTTLCLPPFLLFTGYSISLIKNRKILMGIFFTTFFLNLLCFSDSYMSTPLKSRSGILYVTNLLKPYKITSLDVIFMGEGGEYLPRYLGINQKSIIPFMEVHAFVRGDREHLKLIMNEALISSLNQVNSKELLKPYIYADSPSRELTEYIESRINTLKSGRYFIVVAPKWTIDSYAWFKNLKNNKRAYENTSLFYALMIKTYNDVLGLVYKNPQMQIIGRFDKNYWSVFIFSKK